VRWWCSWQYWPSLYRTYILNWGDKMQVA